LELSGDDVTIEMREYDVEHDVALILGILASGLDPSR
jgi:hypothetical protein